MKKWYPIGDKLIVKVQKLEEKSAGGIVLTTDYVKKESMAREEGIVISIGDTIWGEAYDDFRKRIKVGATIAFARYGGKSLGDDEEGNDLRVMRDVDVLAVLEEDK